MPLKIPPELKKITQYVRRAEELDKDTSPQTRLVAYYSRQHAVTLGIPLATSNDGKQCLGDLLNELEKEKKPMSNFTKKEAYVVCRGFAMKIFDKADSVDRAGMSDKSTAKTFYAAASFLDILRQFDDPSADAAAAEEEKSEDVLEEEKKSFYAKWKATDILKAIREGREVTAGGYGIDPNEEEAEAEDDDALLAEVMKGVASSPPSPPPPIPSVSSAPEEQGTEIGVDGYAYSASTASAPPPPAYPGAMDTMAPPMIPAPPMVPIPPPAAAAATKPAPAARPSPMKSPGDSGKGFKSKKNIFKGFRGNKGGGKHSKAVLNDAKELTKFAMKALDDKNGDLAIERLSQALECLTQS